MMEEINSMVADLIHYRDYFFTKHDVSCAGQKQHFIQERLDEVLAKLDSLDDETKNKAEYLMLRGKALSVATDRQEISEELLSKAVKLNPTLTEAWNCLGELYWTKKDMDGAKNCFLASLNHKKDKASLRNLSLITRSTWKDQEERLKNIDTSLDLAKEALQLDLTDGFSWLTFGNANLAKYFISQNPNLMKQSLSAYIRAETDPVACNSYDLHYNKGTVYEYLEEYEKALLDYDVALRLQPTFEEAAQKESQLVKYLKETTHLLSTKGNIKGKRLKTFVSKITPELHLGSHLPVYLKDGDYSVKNLKDLNTGPNPKTILLGKVVGSLFNNSSVSFTFSIVDKNEDSTAVTVYNALHGWGVKIDDSIAIPDPRLNRINFSYKGDSFDFYTIRVEHPMHMIVNARKPKVNSVSLAVLSSSIEQ
ncbi:hypothetical protein HELRODRAFT_157915 [Helobdella robusta]|uniref:Tetratricopeptide repeat protein 5 OB fold domain-containing protein n=1 Tax=Helobdella robusta TaxID=6412 RepID=T1EMH7_HELRO|nr:hypothetical protein HELRODRAFT_157915 [Helobdella robusta]ESN92440.1 hypothetical protein HELRODRAFT_157915 [Helobdella robusta]